MNLWACFIPQRGSRFGVHLDRVLSLPCFHLADFVPFLAAWSGSEAYGSVADVEAAPQLWAHNVPLRGGRGRLAFVHGCVNFRASRDVKVRNCTEIRLCVCCYVFSAEFIAFFHVLVSLFYSLGSCQCFFLVFLPTCRLQLPRFYASMFRRSLVFFKPVFTDTGVYNRTMLALFLKSALLLLNTGKTGSTLNRLQCKISGLHLKSSTYMYWFAVHERSTFYSKYCIFQKKSPLECA